MHPESRAVERSGWMIPSLEGLAVFLYFARDAFAGVFRYYASLAHLDALWFTPDIFAFLCIGAFAYRYAFKEPNFLAFAVLLYVPFALFLGYIFLGDVKAVASSVKMIAPAFVGFCFCGRQVSDEKLLLKLIHGLFYLSIIGAVWSAHTQLPWVNFSYDSFGVSRSAARLWWTGGESRVSGFSADSTMAAYFIMICYVFTSVRRSMLWCVLWAPAAFYGIHATTNKTALGVLAIYICALAFVRACPEKYRFGTLRAISLWSFACILIPPILMLTLTGVNLARMSQSLYSIQDRINNSWYLPFVYMNDLMPIGYFTGCGLGCFNYPQQLFSNVTAYYVPVDNFYIGTYLMFGPIFVVFMIFVMLAVSRTTDIYKLTVLFVMNFYTVTVLEYGPASGLLIVTLAFSEVFGPRLRARSIYPAPEAPRPLAGHLAARGAG
jgi:hypothetical protein